METMSWVAVLVVVVLLAIGMILRRIGNKTPDRYVCGHCGEKDCECTKQQK